MRRGSIILVRLMTQTTNRILDEMAKLVTDAAGAAQGVKQELESIIRSQGEKVLRDLDVVQREDFEAVKAMAQRAREENDRLSRRVEALEARLMGAEAADPAYSFRVRHRPATQRPVRRTTRKLGI